MPEENSLYFFFFSNTLFGCAFGLLEAQFKLEWEEDNLGCFSGHQAVRDSILNKDEWEVSRQR